MVIKKAESQKMRKYRFSITALNLLYKYKEAEIYQVPTFNASWKTGTPGWYVQASGQKQRRKKNTAL